MEGDPIFSRIFFRKTLHAAQILGHLGQSNKISDVLIRN